jgi:hypothetical protein
MEHLIRKLLGAFVGVVVCIAIWTIQGRLGGSGSETSDSIPAVVWGGGAGVVTIEAEASQPANISVSFASNSPSADPNHDYLETWQKIPAGKSTFDIDVPADVSGSVWVRIDEPNLGAKVKVVVRANGNVVAQDWMRLDQPLEAGYGFAAGVEIGDYARGQASEEGLLD